MRYNGKGVGLRTEYSGQPRPSQAAEMATINNEAESLAHGVGSFVSVDISAGACAGASFTAKLIARGMAFVGGGKTAEAAFTAASRKLRRRLCRATPQEEQA